MIRRLLWRNVPGSVCCAILACTLGCPGTGTVNQPPSASAGPDVSVAGGFLATLDGSDSVDPDGDSLQFEWTQIAGPAVNLENANTATPSFRAPNVMGSARFQLVVIDMAGNTDSDSVTVSMTFSTNVPPSADAGRNLTVRGSEIVALDGTRSTDSDGDLLSFQWTQISGTSVVLSEDDTPSPNFMAPNIDGELFFELTVDDGQAHDDSDVVTVTVIRNAPILFVANAIGNSILRFVDPGSKDGNVAPDTVLEGDDASLDAPTDIVVSRENFLIAVNRGADSLNLYLGSVFASGDSAPFFVVEGNATLLDQPTSLEYVPGEDLVFVSNTGSSSTILVFAGPSEVIFDGNLPPLRVISSTALSLPASIVIDSADRLYVANTGSRDILVFDNASTVSGTVDPSRIITNAAIDDPIAVEIDLEDRLYVVNSTGTILVFQNASTLNGTVTPDAIVSISGAMNLSSIAVDQSGTAFVLDSTIPAVYVIESIASRSGEVTSDATITGSDTGLSSPFGLFLLED